MSVIENVALWFATAVATVTHFLGPFRSRSISQLIKGISRDHYNSRRYFNGTIISTFLGPSLPVSPFIYF